MGRQITNHCLGLTCSIADAVIFVFNVSNYFRNAGEWMRGNTIDLRSEMNLNFFLQLLKVSINKTMENSIKPYHIMQKKIVSCISYHKIFNAFIKENKLSGIIMG